MTEDAWNGMVCERCLGHLEQARCLMSRLARDVGFQSSGIPSLAVASGVLAGVLRNVERDLINHAARRTCGMAPS